MAYGVFRLTRHAELGVLAAGALMLMSQPCLAEEATIETKAGAIKSRNDHAGS